MWCHEGNHFPAVIETCTGHRGRAFDHPSFGSWVSHALGSVNKNLPSFVNIGRPSSPVQLTGGYLGASVSATVSGRPNAHTNLHPPQSTLASECDCQMHLLEIMNADFRQRHAMDSNIQARIKAYQLAASMQLSAPEVVDLQRNQRTFKRSTASTKRPRKLLENNCSWHVGWPNGVFASFKSAMQEEATEAGMRMET